MRAPLALAALLLASPAWGGGINLPWSVGYGSPALAQGAASVAQAICVNASTTYQCSLGGTPTTGDTLFAYCAPSNGTSVTPTVNTGWTSLSSIAQTGGSLGYGGQIWAYHVVVLGDGASYTPCNTQVGAVPGVAIFDVSGLTHTAPPLFVSSNFNGVGNTGGSGSETQPYSAPAANLILVATPNCGTGAGTRTSALSGGGITGVVTVNETGNAACSMAAGYVQAAATGGNVTATWTGSLSGSYGAEAILVVSQ